MPNRNTLAPIPIAIATGMVLWFVAAEFIVAREPWDDPAYWIFAYPLVLVVSVVLAYFYPDRPWRWALILFAAQVVAMWIQTGEIGNLWPLTLVFVGIIALPAVFLAKVTVRIKRRSRA